MTARTFVYTLAVALVAASLALFAFAWDSASAAALHEEAGAEAFECRDYDTGVVICSWVGPDASDPNPCYADDGSVFVCETEDEMVAEPEGDGEVCVEESVRYDDGYPVVFCAYSNVEASDA